MDLEFIHASYVTTPESKYKECLDLMIECINGYLQSVNTISTSYTFTKTKFDLYIKTKLSKIPDNYFHACFPKIIELSQNEGWNVKLCLSKYPRIILSFIVKKGKEKKYYYSKANRTSSNLGIYHIIHPSYMVIKNILNNNTLLKKYFETYIETMNVEIQKSKNKLPYFVFTIDKKSMLVSAEELVCALAVKLNISGWSVQYNGDDIKVYTVTYDKKLNTINASPYY